MKNLFKAIGLVGFITIYIVGAGILGEVLIGPMSSENGSGALIGVIIASFSAGAVALLKGYYDDKEESAKDAKARDARYRDYGY